MPELRARRLAILVCAADEAALDALVAPGHGSRPLRTAADETLVIAPAAVADDVRRELSDRIGALDADALVLDVSDGWTAWGLVGDDARRAFSFMSALEPPAPGAFVQGDVARVGATVLGDEEGLTILVPALWGEHIRERALHDARATEAPA